MRTDDIEAQALEHEFREEVVLERITKMADEIALGSFMSVLQLKEQIPMSQDLVDQVTSDAWDIASRLVRGLEQCRQDYVMQPLPANLAEAMGANDCPAEETSEA